MSEDERKKGDKNKQKMKSKEEEAVYQPEMLEHLLSQMNPMIGKKPRTPVIVKLFQHEFLDSDFASKTELDLLSGAIDAETSSSVAVQVNRNKPQSSNLAHGSKKIVAGKNKGIVIEEEVLPKRMRPKYDNLEKLKKGDSDSDFDPSSDDNTDESDIDYLPGPEGN
ncbi:hypothetical protein K7X08_003441 [Anisodus acutangulus]|uniref:Uncharacterized protein n=1 Tax=Anisodus acutangulus TaxID=402998 RepID=A0A9Q1MIT3_9SOLA|nr:hypothetical protein K7X08_003441 [Anisodus acutangulus]